MIFISLELREGIERTVFKFNTKNNLIFSDKNFIWTVLVIKDRKILQKKKLEGYINSFWQTAWYMVSNDNRKELEEIEEWKVKS